MSYYGEYVDAIRLKNKICELTDNPKIIRKLEEYVNEYTSEHFYRINHLITIFGMNHIQNWPQLMTLSYLFAMTEIHINIAVDICYHKMILHDWQTNSTVNSVMMKYVTYPSGCDISWASSQIARNIITRPPTAEEHAEGVRQLINRINC